MTEQQLDHETRRHRFEVRWCLANGFEWFERYVKRVAERRGQEAAARLWKDVKTQHRLGNSGAAGEWKEETA